MGKPLSASPPLTADGVEKMYHQLAESHAITAAELMECAYWHRSIEVRHDAIHDRIGIIIPK
jgi:hypothetical protein